MMRLAIFYSQAIFFVAMSTLSPTNGNTVVSVSRSQTVGSVDSFTVQGTNNSPCTCEGFGGVSTSHNNRTQGSSICYCRCSLSKPAFSFKTKGASPKCVKDRIAVPADHSDPVKGGVAAAAQQILTTPGSGFPGEAVAPFIDTTTMPAAQGTGSTARPRKVNILLIAIIASVVALGVVIIIAIATWLYFREKKVKLVRERSRNRSRSSQGGSSMIRSEPVQVANTATVHRYEYVDERSSNGPRTTLSLPRTYNPTFDIGADDCVFVELPSIHQQGLTRPWSVAGYSPLSSTRLGQVSKSNKLGYQHLLPMPSASCECPSNDGCAHSQSHKPGGGYQCMVYTPNTANGRTSSKTSSTGKIDVIDQSKTGYQQLIYRPLEQQQREHSDSSRPQCDVAYQPLKARCRRRSEPVAPNDGLPSFDPDYHHLRYKMYFTKGKQGKKRVDSSSDGAMCLCRLSQSESCIVNLVHDTGDQKETEMKPRSTSVGGLHDSGNEPLLSPDDLRTNCYQALARPLSSQHEPRNSAEEEDYEMTHIYHRCSDTELGGSDSEGYTRAELLTRINLLPAMEMDGSDSEGYARPELLTGTSLIPDGSDSEGYARPELLTKTRLLPTTEPDGSDSEGYYMYAQPELVPNTCLLPEPLLLYSSNSDKASESEDCTRPLSPSRLSRDDPNVDADRPLAGVVADCSRSREDSQERSYQPEYMTLEETLQTTGTESTCNKNAEEDDCSKDMSPEYMVLDTPPDGSEADAVKEETLGEKREDEVNIASPDYMVLEIGNPEPGKDGE